MFRSYGLVKTSIRGFSTSAPSFSAKLKVPQPTTEVPDVETFLKKIGRGASEHLEAFPTWKKLFRIASSDLKEKGIEANLRRYILNWRYKFSQDNQIKLREIKTGKKLHGGERKRKAVLAKERILKRNEMREKVAAQAQT